MRGERHEADDSVAHAVGNGEKCDDSFGGGERKSIGTAVESTEDNFIEDERADDDIFDRFRAALGNLPWLADCVAVIGSCFLTFSISNYSPYLHPDFAQAIVVTLALATFPKFAAPAGAGAYAGMASLGTIPSYGWLALLSLVVTSVWLLFQRFKVLIGFGGRLGTCAFISMNVTVALFAMPSGSVPWSYYGGRQLWSDRLKLIPSIQTVIGCTFVATVGGAIRLKSKQELNPVGPGTTVSLLCMLILEPIMGTDTANIDVGFTVGSFVAMASLSYVSSTLSFGMAGFIAGLWILFLDPFFLEFGGKKGFTALCGFSSFVAITKLVGLLKILFGKRKRLEAASGLPVTSTVTRSESMQDMLGFSACGSDKS